MTLHALTPRLIWEGSGSTSSISLSVDGSAITFRDNAHIKVKQIVVATGEITTLVEGTDYTISGGPVTDPDATPGTLTRSAGNLPLGTMWSAYREQPITQEVEIGVGDDFASEDVNEGYDAIVEKLQELGDKVDRAVKVNVFSNGIAVDLPQPEAGQLIGWNDDGDALTNYEQGTLGSSEIPVTDFMKEVLQSADQADARTELGVPSNADLADYLKVDFSNASAAAIDAVFDAETPARVQTYLQGAPDASRKDIRVILPCESATTTAPPGSPTDGQMYLIPASPSGAWSGQAGKIADRQGGAWVFLTPTAGWSVYAKNTGALWVYNGSAWTSVSGASATTGAVQVTLIGKTTTPGGGKVKTWLTANNEVYAAGDNTNSQNGYTIGQTDLPTKILFNVAPGTITKIIQSATSTYFLDSTGKVWSLGGNAAGQLGHADTTNRQIATRIEYFVTNNLTITDIFASGDAGGTADYVFFLTSSGVLYGCGANGNGQLGVGDTSNKSTPTQITAVSSVARAVCSGNQNPHSLLITTAGALWAAGYNGAGQLGLGDTTQRSTFTVVGGFTNASKAAVSGSSTTAVGNSFVLKTDGTVWAAGYNAAGQLGQGDTTTRNAFTQISSLTGITDIQASSDYVSTVAALKSDGNVYIWGNNASGACGTGNTTNQTSPQAPSFSGQGSIAQIVVAAHGSNCSVYARTSAGAVWAAGYSTSGNLGVNSTSATSSTFNPAIIDGSVTVTDIAVTGTASNFGPCVLYSDGRTAVAGDNSKGQLGLGAGTSGSAVYHLVAALTSLGVKGTTGDAGANGTSAGVGFNFSTTTADADPGAGILRLNNATLASATAAYVDNTNRDGNSVTAWLDMFDDQATSSERGILQLFDPAQPDANFRFYQVTGSVVDGTGYRKLTLVHVVGNGTFTNGGHIRAVFFRTGNQGAAGSNGTNGINGTDPGIRWAFATSTTMADPSAGNIRFNNATLASVTAIAISYSSGETGNPSVANFVKAFDDSTTSTHRGYLIVKKAAAPQNYVIFDVTGALTDNTTWAQLAVTVVDSAGSLSASDALSLQFHRTGDGSTPAGSSGQFQYNNGANAFAGGNLFYESANLIAQRNGTTAQLTYIYKTYTDASNYERLEIGATASLFQVNVANAGTGSSRSLALAGNSIRLFVGNNGATEPWNITNQGHILAVTDNTYDLGANGATRPRTGYFATSVVAPIHTLTQGTITADAPQINGTVTLNNAGVTFTAWKLNVTDTASASGSLLMDLQVGGTSKAQIRKDGQISSRTVGSASNPSFQIGTNGQTGIYSATLDSDISLTFGSTRGVAFGASFAAVLSNTGSFHLGASLDVTLTRDAANTLALRNSTSAQTFRVYGSYTDVSNYERAFMTTDGGGLGQIGAQGAGTGANPVLRVVGYHVDIGANNGSTIGFRFSAAGNFICPTDNTYDIGASGATRPRYIYVGSGLVSGDVVRAGATGYFTFSTTRSAIGSPADGNIVLYNAAASSFGLLQLGGTTSSFPALKRSSTDLQVRLADDSGYAGLQLGSTSAALKVGTHSAIGAETVTGYITIKDSGGTDRKIAVVS